MYNVSAMEIKQRSLELGAALCGIAPIERFNGAPAGFHPAEVITGCQSVIVLALPFPASTLTASSQALYTFVRNQLVSMMDSITFQLAVELEAMGKCAVAIPSSDPYDYWDETRRHGQGVISLKHAAVQAGLGKMGKNTLLLHHQLGNMLWLGAVLVEEKIEPDPLTTYETCLPDCRICLDACPVKALDGATIVQRKCREISGKYTDGGGYVYACNICRKVCPNHRGMKG